MLKLRHKRLTYASGRMPFPRNVWCSIVTAVLLFFGLQIGFFYRDYLLLDEQKSDLEEVIRNKERMIYDQKFSIISKERELFRLENKLKNLESRLRLLSSNSVDFKRSSSLPTVYIITPTYSRPTQKCDLIRLSHTLSLVPKIFWVVVEDSNAGTSTLVKEILRRSKIRHSLISAPTPDKYKRKKGESSFFRPRGVAQRNEGLTWLRKNLSTNTTGVVYFADDDNAYDLLLFEEMRTIRKIGVWPVAFVGQLMVERPKVENGKVAGWSVAWRPERPYAVDMAGFAVNIQLLLQRSDVMFSQNVSRGYQETHFISQLISGIEELEPKANFCTQVLVWHTKTKEPNLLSELKGEESYLNVEV